MFTHKAANLDSTRMRQARKIQVWAGPLPHLGRYLIFIEV